MKRYLYWIVWVFLAMAIGESANAKDKAYKAEGTHQLVQVVHIGTYSEINQGEGRWIYDTLIGQGMSDAEIQEGQIVRGNTTCCRPDPRKDAGFVFFAGQNTELSLGDIVEIRLGRKPNRRKKDLGTLPTAIGIRESADDFGKHCRWVPDDPSMWGRILYCDWMESEGWAYQKGLFKTWYKSDVVEANSKRSERY